MAATDASPALLADVESVTVNEVITALLAKVKQLSAEIEELRGA